MSKEILFDERMDRQTDNIHITDRGKTGVQWQCSDSLSGKNHTKKLGMSHCGDVRIRHPDK